MTSPFAPSSRSAIAPFEVMDVLATVARMRAEGREVISLCAGEPSQGAPGPVHETAAAIHAEGRALGYTPALGTAALRAAIAGHYRRWYGFDVDPTEVAVTTGSSGGFVLAFLAAFDHGDRVALARPGYPAYRNILAGLGCEVVDLGIVPDKLDATRAALRDAASKADVILTSGGTGLTQDDQTVEAVAPHITRELPGIAVAFWQKGLESVPTAMASRAIAGVNDSTFAMTLPGSTGGVKDGCAVLDELIVPIVDMLEGKHEH